MNSADCSGSESHRETIDEQVRRKGIRPVEDVADLAQDGVFASAEEVKLFIAHVYAARRADLA